ncbi:MAG: ATP-binding cassette domain-containing protein [Promethearchaeota archaeon]|nr:MAG: ATP-binding cassette domain-containing protein [Candidatus Lokiarchaeota archaeon]
MNEYRKKGVLAKYFKKYWYLIAISVVFATASNIFSLRLPQFISLLIDEIIPSLNGETPSITNQDLMWFLFSDNLMWDFIINLALIFFIAGMCELVRMIFQQNLRTNIIFNIRNDMFVSLSRQSYSFYDRNRTGNLMSKATSDVNAIKNFLANQFQNVIRNVVSLFIIFFYVWQIQPVMTFIFLSLTPPLFILMFWYRKRIRPASQEMYESRGQMLSTIEENIGGVRVVKAFGRQELEMGKYHNDNNIFLKKSKRVIGLQTIYGPLSEYFTMIGSAGILLLGGYLVTHSGENAFSLGSVVATFVYFVTVYEPIRAIVNFFNELSANRAALTRVNEIIDNRNEIQVPTMPIDPSRALGDLYLRLLKDEKIIDNIDALIGMPKPEETRREKRTKRILRRFEETTILPKNVKTSAVETIYFKGNEPIIFNGLNVITPLSQKISILTKRPEFQDELQELSKEEFRSREIRIDNPITFIARYLCYLIENQELMENVYHRLRFVYDTTLSELRKDPLDSLLLYIDYFAENEFEQMRVTELQKTLYSPEPHVHTAIAKKYEKLLIKKGIIPATRTDMVVGSKVITQDALSFLRLEKEVLRKQFEKIHKKRIKKTALDVPDEILVPNIIPIQINTKFEDLALTPVDPSEYNGHVVFKDVNFSYDDVLENQEPRLALAGITLDIRPGETVAFLGATGSGKTTLINLIPRFYEVTQGNIYIDGIDIRELDLNHYRQNIGIVAQESFLFSRSIKDNICYGKKHVREEDMFAVAKIAKIHEFIMGLPDKYDTVVGERGQTLSGGQKQRVAIARALLQDPKILILDDSLSAVDVDTEFEIQEALEHLFEGRTTFIITQRLSTVRNCDRIFVLDDGKIIEQGTHENLMQLNGIYTKIYQTMYKRHVRGKEAAALQDGETHVEIPFDKTKPKNSEEVSD